MITESSIENGTDRQISVAWSPTVLRRSGADWIALPCDDPEYAAGRVCEAIKVGPRVIPVGQVDDVVDLWSWPPEPPVPGLYAIVLPVWPRGLDVVETPPTLGVVDLITLGGQ